MKKIIISFLVILLVSIAVFSYVALYLPYTKIRAKGLVVVASAKQMKAVFAKNDIDLLTTEMKKFRKTYDDFQNEAKAVYWMSFISYIRDFKNGVEAGDHILTAGQEGINAIAPYADLIGFKKGQSSFVEKSTEGRLQTAVLTLDKVLGKIDVISDNIKIAEEKINTIDPKRYPEQLGKTKVRSTLTNAKEQFVGLASLFVDAKPLLKNIPNIMGAKGEKTYLLLFQNDKEKRATGGFLTAYAIFKIKEGKIKIDRSEDIYRLDNCIAVHPEAPKEILTYHKNVTKFYIRDSNLSPDFVKSIDLFNSLYNKCGGKVKYDGIIALDTKILVDMLTIFGDTEADGIRFSASIDKRCNCPSVIYRLFELVDEEVGYVKENRKGILGSLMYELFYKAIGFSPSKYWGTLAQTMFKNLDEKHILLYFTDPQIQASIEKLDYGGRIRDYSGDYLHINNVNFAGAKSNLFVSESYTSKTKTENGALAREVTVEYKNPFPHSDCNRNSERILCLNATLRNWIRVYVPKGSKLNEFKGSMKKVNTYDELGKTVFEGYLEIIPEGMSKAIISYTLPASVPSGDAYSLYVQKQPGAQNQKWVVEYNGKKLYNNILEKDTVIKK